MSADVSVKRVRDLATRVQVLREKVGEVVRPKPYFSRRVPFVDAQRLSWIAPDRTYKEIVYVNGGEDVFISAMSYNAGTVLVAPQAQSAYTCLENSGQLLTASLEDQAFDFVWNYRVTHSQAIYGNAANAARNGLMLSRKALGFYERGEYMTFTYPLQIKAGDSLVWMVQPTFEDGVIGSTRFDLDMVLFGWRDGAIATPAWSVK